MLLATASNLTISNNTITGRGSRHRHPPLPAGSTNITIDNNVIRTHSPRVPGESGFGVDVDAAIDRRSHARLQHLQRLGRRPSTTSARRHPSPPRRCQTGTVGSPYSAALAGDDPEHTVDVVSVRSWDLPPGLTLASHRIDLRHPRPLRGHSPSP